jgi:hypothetical protein
MHESFATYSINGFIDITGLTKTSIAGSFEFVSVNTPQGSPLVDTISVQNGQFYVPITLVSGMPLEGPEQ